MNKGSSEVYIAYHEAFPETSGPTSFLDGAILKPVRALRRLLNSPLFDISVELSVPCVYPYPISEGTQERPPFRVPGFLRQLRLHILSPPSVIAPPLLLNILSTCHKCDRHFGPSFLIPP